MQILAFAATEAAPKQPDTTRQSTQSSKVECRTDSDASHFFSLCFCLTSIPFLLDALCTAAVRFIGPNPLALSFAFIVCLFCCCILYFVKDNNDDNQCKDDE